MTVASILTAILIAVVIWAVGTYVLHAPEPVVGLVAFLVLLLLIFGGVPVR